MPPTTNTAPRGPQSPLPSKPVPGLEVRGTQLGHGLFASRQFRRGKIFGPVQGTVRDDPNYSSEYCIDLGEGRTLEPDAPFRFLNHSCEPNCELFVWDRQQGADAPDGVWLSVLKTLRPGDELTIDYGWHADAAIPCLCGAETCRGWVVSADQLPLVEAPR